MSKCIICRGMGRVPDPVGDVDDMGHQQTVLCTNCRGSGEVNLESEAKHD